MRRLAIVAAAAGLVLAGCGGGGDGDDAEKPAATSARTTPEKRVPPLSELEAVRETQSIASQEAFRRDFSFPANAIVATCTPLPPEAERGRFACRYRSPKRSCTGTVEIARLPDGSNIPRRFTIKCTGPPNIGPDPREVTG